MPSLCCAFLCVYQQDGQWSLSVDWFQWHVAGWASSSDALLPSAHGQQKAHRLCPQQPLQRQLPNRVKRKHQKCVPPQHASSHHNLLNLCGNLLNLCGCLQLDRASVPFAMVCQAKCAGFCHEPRGSSRLGLASVGMHPSQPSSEQAREVIVLQ